MTEHDMDWYLCFPLSPLYKCTMNNRLLDGDVGAGGPDGTFNVFKQKKFKMLPVQKICQRYPVVPQCQYQYVYSYQYGYALYRAPPYGKEKALKASPEVEIVAQFRFASRRKYPFWGQ